MAGDDNNDRYREGQVDKELEIMNKTLTRFEEKLDNNLEWQRGVDIRLASGVEKFGSQNRRFTGQDKKIEINRKNIIRVGGVNLTLTGLAAYVAAKLGIGS